MAMSADASVTLWQMEAKAGSDAATQRLWERYFKRLLVTARTVERKPQLVRTLLKSEAR
jgi:hypothetical protein